MTVPEILALFPNLPNGRKPGNEAVRERSEQQEPAITHSRARSDPCCCSTSRSEGLAPVIIEQIGLTIRKLKDRGISILLVEQNANFATASRTGITSWSMER